MPTFELTAEQLAFAPKWYRIYADIKQRIDTGTLPVSAQLPSTTEAQKKYDASHITVERAYRELEHDGLIERKQGIGTFVANVKKDDGAPPRTVCPTCGQAISA